MKVAVPRLRESSASPGEPAVAEEDGGEGLSPLCQATEGQRQVSLSLGLLGSEIGIALTGAACGCARTHVQACRGQGEGPYWVI